MAAPSELPRWMEHRRPEDDRVQTTTLRVWPRDDSPFISQNGACLGTSLLRREVVEVLEPRVVNNSYVEVRMMAPRAFGWVKRAYLHDCPEGSDEHGRLSAQTGVVEMSEVRGSRLRTLRHLLWSTSKGQLQVTKCEFIAGHFLGKTGMEHGPKELLFHGTSKEGADSIVQGGFDDQNARSGKFGKGLYFSPHAMTSYGYGRELLLCEVALGWEPQRVIATEMSNDYSWKGLLAQGKRSVQCHTKEFGQEERVVYHCTQCKPVYRLFVSEVADARPRWMRHTRPADDAVRTTLLRPRPTADEVYIDGMPLDQEVVERMSEDVNGYTRVMLAVTGVEGWVKSSYLHGCSEGTRVHRQLIGESQTVARIELKRGSRRFKEIADLVEKSVCSSKACRLAYQDREIQAQRIWFVSGHYLGETGMQTGPKAVLFHGTNDAAVESIASSGFDMQFVKSGKACGPGLYFSPQSCKAFSYSQKFLLLCDVALGMEEHRLTVTQRSPHLNYEEVFVKLGKRSVQSHARAPFNHEERVVYKPTQCKPVYIIQMTCSSPCHGV